jgi:glycosyltransferase involved in cell wall biosynthesis
MRILVSAFECDPSKGSEAGNGWNWAYHLALEGFEVHVLTTSAGKQAISAQVKENLYLQHRLCFHYVDHAPFWARAYHKNSILMWLAYYVWQLKVYRYAKALGEAFDVVHHITWGSLKIGSALYKLGVPFIFGPVGGGHTAPLSLKKFLYSDFPSERVRNLAGPAFAYFNPLTRHSLKSARAVLTTNKETMELAKILGGKNVHLILDTALAKDFAPAEMPQRNQHKLVLLWVGRIFAFKGLGLVLESLANVPEAVLKNIELHIVGDGPFRAEAEQITIRLGLIQVVRFHGTVPYSEVKRFYASANAFIYCSLRDSCPAQVLEAQAYGLPVITLDLHGQSLLVMEDRGIKCKVSTPEKTTAEIAEAIMKLAAEPELRIKLGARGFAFAQTQVWPTKVAAIIQAYYEAEAIEV